MRLGLIAAASALTLGCLAATASAQCDDKSQQNAADEASAGKGDLAAGSKCADPSDVARSQQKLEDAAERAKRKIDETSGTEKRSGPSAQGDRGENSPGRPSER
jgi:hypothetical protein